MPVKRGDVILAYVPNIGSPGGKVRPALIVQADHNNARLNETNIAAITSNIARVHEPTQLLIDIRPRTVPRRGCCTIRRCTARGCTRSRRRTFAGRLAGSLPR